MTAKVAPGLFHRVGIAADPEGADVGRWLVRTVGGRPLPGGMVQVLGLPFGDGVMRSEESGAASELLWVGGSPSCPLCPLPTGRPLRAPRSTSSRSPGPPRWSGTPRPPPRRWPG